MKPTYDTTLARIAWNIAAGLVSGHLPQTDDDYAWVSGTAVALAQTIVARCRAEATTESPR